MEQEIQLNEHNKQEYPPMHTAEHLLNSQMVKYFHCERSFSAHIEKKNLNVITTSKRHLLPKTLPPWSKR